MAAAAFHYCCQRRRHIAAAAACGVDKVPSCGIAAWRRRHNVAAAASSCLTTLLRAVRILDSFHLRRRQHLIISFFLLVMQNMTLCDHSWYNTVWRRPPPHSLRGARVVEASTTRVALQQPRSQQGPLPKGGDGTRGRHIRNGLHQTGPRAPPLAGDRWQTTAMP